MNVPVCKACKTAFDTKSRRPIILPKCGHSICSTCLRQQISATNGQSVTCPEDSQVYEKIASVSQLPENTTLLRLIEIREDSVCPEHKKVFDFYCLTDLVP